MRKPRVKHKESQLVFQKAKCALRSQSSSPVFKDNENPYFYCTLFLFSFRIGIDLGI